MDLFSLNRENEDDILLVELFGAYRDARKNKRNKRTQVAFEIDYERKLMRLHKSIVQRRYRPLRSTAFISTQPVIREVFAAHFQDRVVHHLIYKHLSPIFEKKFIEDSYSCRRGKGTLYGVNRIYDFVAECSENYSRDAYILKLDIEGYFYSIDKNILYEMIRKELYKQSASLEIGVDTLDYLIKSTIFTDPTKNVKIYRDDSNWAKLPKSKSLFYAKEDCGLPIGNLTSQLFSNIYMHIFDKFVIEELGIMYYGRYVDDFVLIDRDKRDLLSAVKKIKLSLSEKLHLRLHPKKIYIQHFSRGVAFLGAYMKPSVKYIERRTKRNFYALIEQINMEFKKSAPSDIYLHQVRSSVNSYLGTMIHFSTYGLRKKILSHLDASFYHYFMVDKSFSRVVLKRYY